MDGCGRPRERLREEVRKLLSQAEAADAEEDTPLWAGRRGDELPEELQRREARIQRHCGERTRRALEEHEPREQAESAGKDAGKRPSAEPTPKTQYNFTDPESRIMKGPEGFVQAYNTQIAGRAELSIDCRTNGHASGQRQTGR